MRAGWNLPKPETVPRPTAWPPALALAITLFAWGLLVSPILLTIGGLLFVVALGGWIGDLRHED